MPAEKAPDHAGPTHSPVQLFQNRTKCSKIAEFVQGAATADSAMPFPEPPLAASPAG